MKSLRNFFTVLVLFVLHQSTFAQYGYIFKTPFPKQIHLLDSVCISLARLDSQTFYNEIAKLLQTQTATTVNWSMRTRVHAANFILP